MQNLNFKPHRLKLMLAISFSLFLLASSVARPQQQPFPALDQGLEPLRSRFNQDLGKVRLLVIVDPTCPPCRWGASEIEKQVLETIPSDRLAVYVVWIPVLNFQDQATLQRNGQKESGRVSDPRAIHFIDPQGFLGKAYSPVLSVPYHAPAWDVYLAFGSAARWGDHVPSPADWMMQGDFAPSRTLNGRKLAEQVQKLLTTANGSAAAH